MIEFVLNQTKIQTELPAGTAMLDFIRKHQQLTGSKLVCKEGECGACSVLVGSHSDDGMIYQSMTSCIMPLINAHGKHIVTIEGLNMEQLTPVQQAMTDQYGTQCGYCTPGFVVSLSGYLLSGGKPQIEGIIAAIDGNICRCTGYKSIERAAADICKRVLPDMSEMSIDSLVSAGYIPRYFQEIDALIKDINPITHHPKAPRTVGGGTDLYVQRPKQMYEAVIQGVYSIPAMNQISIEGDECTFGAACTMGDLYRSTVFQEAVPDADYMFKLLSSTQIRNMATIGGNLVNASPIGDFTIILLALDADLILRLGDHTRQVALKDFYKEYKVTDLQENELVEQIKFKATRDRSHFHFEKVSQRKYFDIASVNLASQIEIEDGIIKEAHLAIGGVGPIPMYLHQVRASIIGKEMNGSTMELAIQKLQEEISPISDARGSSDYKRLLARQLLIAQFLAIDPVICDHHQIMAL